MIDQSICNCPALPYLHRPGIGGCLYAGRVTTATTATDQPNDTIKPATDEEVERAREVAPTLGTKKLILSLIARIAVERESKDVYLHNWREQSRYLEEAKAKTQKLEVELALANGRWNTRHAVAIERIGTHGEHASDVAAVLSRNAELEAALDAERSARERAEFQLSNSEIGARDIAAQLAEVERALAVAGHGDECACERYSDCVASLLRERMTEEATVGVVDQIIRAYELSPDEADPLTDMILAARGDRNP